MKNILFINPAGCIGGAEKSLIDLVTGLPRERFQPLVVTLGPGPLAGELNQLGIESREILLHSAILNLSRGRGKNRWLTLPGIPFLVLPTLNRLFRLIREESIDLIHTNGLKAHLLGCLLTGLSRRPLIWHYRDLPAATGCYRFFRSLARVFPTKIIANSRAVKERLGNLNKTKVIYNGVDITQFQEGKKTSNLREEFRFSHNDLIIGTIGHFAPLKGYNDLILALPLILKNDPRVRLLIVGGSIYPAYQDYKKELQGLIDRLDLTDKVIFTGERDDLPALLNTLDIFVLPSWSEGFGRANLEAMAAGRPVVSTNVGGIPEVVADGETGILVPPRDPGDLAEAIIRLAKDENLRKKMGAAGRIRAENFSIQKMVGGVVELYKEIIPEINAPKTRHREVAPERKTPSCSR